jgi:5-methylthioadenosine/S-adenosylhomocysteine deaminase
VKTVFRDVLLYDPSADRALSESKTVIIDDGRIAAVQHGWERDDSTGADCVVDGHGHHLLLPGLINAHFHSPANHLKGALPPLPLELFMLYESPTHEFLRPTPREAYLRTVLGALDMLRTGTTTVQDDAFLMPTPEPEVIDAVCQAYLDCGIRAVVALDQPDLPEVDKLPPLPDLPSACRVALDAPAPMPPDELLERYKYLFDVWHGTADGRIRAAVSISAPQRVSPSYFAALDQLSAEHGTPLFAHMLETKLQRVLADAQPRFSGRSLVKWTDDLGLLNERTNVIHAVWVDGDDLELIATAGATVVHNPVSNLRLGSGVMPWRAIRARKIPVALGVDEAICNDATDMWNVLKTAGMIHTITGAPATTWPSAAEILDAVWLGGATAAGQPGLGRVEEGAVADLILIDLHAPAFTPLNDAAGQLVWCEQGSSVVMTMVDGAVVAEGRRVITVDEEALLAEARECFERRRPQWHQAWADAEKVTAAYRAMIERAAGQDVGFSRWVGAT